MSGSQESGWIRRAHPGLLFVLLILAVYADPLFLRRNFAGHDLLGYSLPVEHSIHDAYSRGRLPVWVSEISGGRPLMPNPNTGSLYPVRPLLALLPFPLAMRIYPILHWALAGLGMIVLLRSLRASQAAAWTGAVTYALSGVSVTEVFYSNIQPGMTLLPWLLWAFGRPMARTAHYVLPLSALFALSFLAGDVFTSALAIGCCLLWLVLEREPTQQKRALTLLGLSLLLAALLAAPQILATALWIPATNRAVLGMKLEEVFFFSVSPFRIFEFVVPFPFGTTWEHDATRVWGRPLFRDKTMGFFASLYAGAFAVFALVTARKERAPGARFARVLFFLGLAVSALPALAPASWNEVPSPLALRYPEKLAVALVLALAILAGIAFDMYRRTPRSLRWTVAVGAILALLASCALLFPGATGWIAVGLVGNHSELASTAADLLPAALAEGGLLWMATIVAVNLLGRTGTWRFAVCMALLTLVPIAANRKIALTFRQEEVLGMPSLDRYLQRQDPMSSFRTLSESFYQGSSELEMAHVGADIALVEFARRGWDLYTHALWNRGTVFNTDFDVGDLSRFESLRHISASAASYGDAQAFFGTLALRWGVRFSDQRALAGYRQIGGSGIRRWDEHRFAYRDIRLLESWREEPGGVAALQALPRLAAGEIVIETERRVLGRARPGIVRVIEKSPERLRLETDASDPGWLFVLRGYWDYRTVLVDGRETEVFPAQLAFSAVPIPAGRHRVDWRERVPGWELSRWGPVLFGIAAAFLLFGERRGKTTA